MEADESVPVQPPTPEQLAKAAGRISRQPPAEPVAAEPVAAGLRSGWFAHRRSRIAAEIARNRSGEYQVPTWGLVLVLVVFVGAWATLVVFS